MKKNNIRLYNFLVICILMTIVLGNSTNTNNDVQSNSNSFPSPTDSPVLMITIKDLDNALLPNAVIQITDTINTYEQTSDSNGNVSFSTIASGTWTIKVYYSVGDKNKEYLIAESSTDYQNIDKYLTINCNMTTIDLTVGDSALESQRDIWGLYNANLTLIDPFYNTIITSFYSDVNGLISMRVPATNYNISIQYQSLGRSFFFYDPVATNELKYIQNLTVTSHISYDVYVSISEKNTQLNLLSTNFLHNEWTNQSTIGRPSYIKLFYEDIVSFKLEWKDTKNNSGIIKPLSDIWNTWSLIYNNNEVNSSSISNAVEPISGENGNYSFIFDSTDYFAGNYKLSLKFNKTGYQDAILTINIEIWNHTTQLKRIPDSSSLITYWNNNINIRVNYTSIIPYVQNITNAKLNYSIAGTSFAGVLDKIPSTGLYELNALMDLPVSETPYLLKIYGNQTNFGYVTLTISLTVQAVPTELEYVLDDWLKISSNYMKVAHNENISFMVNYTDNSGSGLEESNIAILMDGIPLSNAYIHLIQNGLWNVSFSSNSYSSDLLHSLKTTITKGNYETQYSNLTIEVLDFWNTDTLMVISPDIYDWGEVVSFKMKYFCAETPVPSLRYNKPLAGATVSGLIVIIKQGIDELIQLTLDTSSLNSIWGYLDLSYLGGENVGLYQIWMNSTYLGVNQSTTFFIKPTFTIPLYRDATNLNTYFELSPVNTRIVAFNQSNLINPLIFFNLDKSGNENASISVQLNISDSNNPLDTQPVQNGNLTFEIRTKSTDLPVQSIQIISHTTSGKYVFSIKSFDFSLGDYRCIVYMNTLNYSLMSCAFDFNITTKVDFNITIPALYKTSKFSLKAAIGENFSFYINFTDAIGINLFIYIDSDTTPMSCVYNVPPNDFLCTDLSGLYSIGPHTLLIRASKSLNIFTEKSLSLEVIENWKSNIEIQTPPNRLYYGSNVSFVLKYSGTEEPRSKNFMLNEADIPMLIIAIGDSFQVQLDASTLDISWGWSSLNTTAGFGPGYYKVWYLANQFEVYSDTLIYAVPLLQKSLYADAFIICPTTISPIGTNLYYNATSTPTNGFPANFKILTLFNGESSKILANYSLFEPTHQNNGIMLTNAIISYSITNKSSNVTIKTDIFTLNGDGLFELTLNYDDLSPHEFTVIIQATYLNYSTQSFQFTLIVGQSLTELGHTVNNRLKGDPNTHNLIKVAYGENFSITIEVIGADDSEAWAEVYIGDYFIPANYVRRIGTSRFFQVEYPITSTIPADDYQVIIFGNKIGQILSNQTFSAEIMTAWPSTLHIIEPPLRYPWGNIIQFNATYYCTEYPRANELLIGAHFLQMDILLIRENNAQSYLHLTPVTLGKMWGYEELVGIAGKGAGYYQIWFNSTYINLTKQEAFYLVPTIVVDNYNETIASPRPNCFVYPLPTKFIITQNTTITGIDLQNIAVYLNDIFRLNLRYFVNDLASIKNGQGIAGTISYIIKYRNNDSIYEIGLMMFSESGYCLWNLPTIEIGNYSITLTVYSPNLTPNTVTFNFLVQKYEAVLDLTDADSQGVTISPQNENLTIYLTAIDWRTNKPLTGGTLIAQFNGKLYICQEDANTPGLYYFTINSDDFSNLTVGDLYQVQMVFSKENYNDFSFPVYVKIDLPVDPIFGVPYVYWAVIGISVGVFIAAVVVRYGIIQARIPLVIKRISMVQKIIMKNRVAPDNRLMLSANEEIFKKFKHEWAILDLDLLEPLGITKISINDEELTKYMGESDSDTQLALDKISAIKKADEAEEAAERAETQSTVENIDTTAKITPDTTAKIEEKPESPSKEEKK